MTYNALILHVFLSPCSATTSLLSPFYRGMEGNDKTTNIKACVYYSQSFRRRRKRQIQKNDRDLENEDQGTRVNK